MNNYISYTVIQAFDSDDRRDIRRSFTVRTAAEAAFREAARTQKTGSVTLYGERQAAHEPMPKPFDASKIFADEYMPDVLDYVGFDDDSPSFNHTSGEFVYA